MVQTMKECQKEYFEKEGYTIIDNKALQRAGQTEKAEAWNREYKEQ